MIIEKGYSSHYLYINLNNESWEVKRISQALEREYLGGKGIGLKLFNDLIEDPASLDPLGGENPLLLINSSLLGTGAPCSSTFEGVTKSPLTQIMSSDTCCGPFGTACRSAGWDGVIITGRASSSMVVLIHYEGVEFRSAGDIWGMKTSEAREHLHLGVRDGELIIGPAGENQVSYATIRSGEMSFGRGGMGAVMGSKRLKAVIAHGRSYIFKPVVPKEFEQSKRVIRKAVERSEYVHSCREFGTNAFIQSGIDHQFLPERNFQRMTGSQGVTLTGQRLQSRYLQRFSSCPHCMVLCGHKGTYPDGMLRRIPGFETTGMFGPNIGNYNPDVIGQWHDLLNELGLDPVSTGGTLAWAMEAHSRGLLPFDIEFDSPEKIEGILYMIAQKRDFGKELAKGSRVLSRSYGGQEFAAQVKGLEMPPIDPRRAWGQGLSFAVSGSGADHRNSGIYYLEVVAHLLPSSSQHVKAHWVLFFEQVYSLAASLQVCSHLVIPLLFESGVIRRLPKRVLRFLMNWFPGLISSLMRKNLPHTLYQSITGFPLSPKQVFDAGSRIQLLERYLNTRMGMCREDEVLPARFAAESPQEIEEPIPWEQMRETYYQLSGCDEQGRPTAERLRQFGLS